MLRRLITDEARWLVIRLAEYDPVKAKDIEERCTLREVAEAAVIKQYDHSAKPVETRGRKKYG